MASADVFHKRLTLSWVTKIKSDERFIRSRYFRNSSISSRISFTVFVINSDALVRGHITIVDLGALIEAHALLNNKSLQLPKSGNRNQ